MHPVVIYNIDIYQSLVLRDQLITAGLVMNQDFEWRYCPPKWDGFSQPEHPRHTVFDFRDAVVATFYRLKWL